MMQDGLRPSALIPHRFIVDDAARDGAGLLRLSSICPGSTPSGRPDNATAQICGGASRAKASAAAFG